MKKWLILFSFLFLLDVHAACDYETQNSLRIKAGNITANSIVEEISTGEFKESLYPDESGKRPLIEVVDNAAVSTIYNLTEDLYLVVRNMNTQEEITYHYADSVNGTITWQSFDLSQIVSYEIKIFSNHEDCFGDELAKLKIVSPKLNDYYFMPYCQGVNHYYCKQFITEELNLTEEQLKNLAFEEQAKMDNDGKTVEDGVLEKNFWETYKFYIIGCIVALGVLVMIIFLIKRRQRSDVL